MKKVKNVINPKAEKKVKGKKEYVGSILVLDLLKEFEVALSKFVAKKMTVLSKKLNKLMK